MRALVLGLFVALAALATVHADDIYYRSSTSFNDGYGYGWDNTFQSGGYSHTSTGYVSEGPYRCIGSGCGYTYYLQNGYGSGRYSNYGYGGYYSGWHEYRPEYRGQPRYPRDCNQYWRDCGTRW